MRYEYVPNDPQRFATNLRRDSAGGNLTWDNARGQEVLIIQTPFGQSAMDKMPQICEALPSAPPHGRYAEVLPGVWARFVSAVEKARNNGCPLNGEASTYAVFACDTQQDVCHIFQPQEQTMITPCCDVPLELRVDVAKSTRQEGVLRKRVVETGFYRLTFPENCGKGYVDGDLRYQVGNLVIPVTRQMLEQGEVYVKTEVKPRLFSVNKGLRLV